MGIDRRVYCRFCQQTYFADSDERCSLCGRVGGLVDAARAHSTLHSVRSANQRQEQGATVADLRVPLPHEHFPPANEIVAHGRGGMAMYYIGAAVWLAGVLLIIGNFTGYFPTFPYAGFLVTVIGVLIQSAGNAATKNANALMLAQVHAAAARRAAAENTGEPNEASSRLGESNRS